MRYLDTSHRDPDHALGTWLNTNLTAEIVALRMQSGYFSGEGLGVFIDTFNRFTEHDLVLNTIIGSNECSTLHNDVVRLVQLAGVPRPNAQIGLVCFSGNLFHPKTFHLTREDGSQCALVGSANLTRAGVTGINIEACISMDTRDGDLEDVLNNIAFAIDNWFVTRPDGLNIISGLEDVDDLLAGGLLALTPPPRTTTGSSGSGSTESTARPRLRPLISIPTPPTVQSISPTEAPAEESEAASPSVPRPEFPDYILFDPAASDPTSGTGALSGSSLPSGATGLIIQLNRDSARHFSDRPGTANISIPVASVTSIRFGIFSGRYERPRAEFELLVRYIGQASTILVEPVNTNIMAYGFSVGESGHGDVRMVVPARVKVLAEEINRLGMLIPDDGDFAILEWPTAESPVFRLTFVERDSQLYATISSIFTGASDSHQLVGGGACWLSPGISPVW